MLIIAHRGGGSDHPDNSAAAFHHGVTVGADIIECDLQLSADGEMVIYHESKIFGASVSDFTTDELRALIPSLLTFTEMLDFLGTIDPSTRLVLDLKSRDVDGPLSAYLIDDDLRGRVLVTSTFSMGLWRLRKRFGDLRTGLSRGATFTRIPDRFRPLAARTVGRLMVMIAIFYMKALGIRVAALRHDLIDAKTMRACHHHGMRVDAWTVDSESRALELRALGVDFMTTNVPKRMVSLS